jgi:hypothetical protein
MGVTMTLIYFLGASMAGWPEKMGGQRMSTHSHAGKLVGRRKELDGPHESIQCCVRQLLGRRREMSAPAGSLFVDAAAMGVLAAETGRHGGPWDGGAGVLNEPSGRTGQV